MLFLNEHVINNRSTLSETINFKEQTHSRRVNPVFGEASSVSAKRTRSAVNKNSPSAHVAPLSSLANVPQTTITRLSLHVFTNGYQLRLTQTELAIYLDVVLQTGECNTWSNLLNLNECFNKKTIVKMLELHHLKKLNLI